MKKILMISILAVMLILATVTQVNATTNDTLSDELYTLCSPYGLTSSDKVRIERYLADYPVTDSEADSIIAKAKEAIAIFDAAGVTNYANLTDAQKEEVKNIATEVANIVDVTLVFKTNTVDVYKNGKLVDSVTETNGKLSYTGNTSNVILVVSVVAVIALVSASFVVARKKLANA